MRVFSTDVVDSWLESCDLRFGFRSSVPLYPNMYLIPRGYVFYAGRAITPTPPGDKTLALRLSDLTWHVVTSGFTDGGIGEHNSSCMFAPGTGWMANRAGGHEAKKVTQKR
ncbi:MAG: hypothetical protein KatS3mg015_1453 [Fimbriimonadales bacterium]|nr:MAG: hypothetical protein KatS3mg015_1453 [Fimbriimonadales bacterium]